MQNRRRATLMTLTAAALGAALLAGCQANGRQGAVLGPLSGQARHQNEFAFRQIDRVKPKHCITQAGEMDNTISLMADPSGEGMAVTGGPNSFRKGQKVDMLVMFGDERDATDPFKIFGAEATSAHTAIWQNKQSGKQLLNRIAEAGGAAVLVCTNALNCKPFKSFVLPNAREAVGELRACARK